MLMVISWAEEKTCASDMCSEMGSLVVLMKFSSSARARESTDSETAGFLA